MNLPKTESLPYNNCMLTIAICDDNKNSRDTIKQFAASFCTKNSQRFSVLGFDCGEDLVDKCPPSLDLLFLDIQMGGMNGIDTARVLRESHPDLCIIFITNLPQYALKSYEVRPFGFMTKPISYDDWQFEVNLAMKYISRNEAHRIVFKCKNSDMKKIISTRDLLFLESKNHDILAHTADGTEDVFLGSLNEMEEELGQYGFIRCHQSFLVNARGIKSFDTRIEMEDGSFIPISRNRRKQFMSDLAAFVGQKT